MVFKNPCVLALSMKVASVLEELIQFVDLDLSATVVDNIDASEIKNWDEVNSAAAMLGVKGQYLSDALTTRTIFTHGETVVTTMSTVASIDVRDAAVKGIYGRLFVWLVQKINNAIYNPQESTRHYRKSIGVLDIFGFENFGKNR